MHGAINHHSVTLASRLYESLFYCTNHNEWQR